MLYDLSDNFQREQFLARATLLASKRGIAELTSRRPRSSGTNAYLHAMLRYFATQYGESEDYVKEVIFKRDVNRDIFLVDRESEARGRYVTTKSTANVSQEELSLCIERFRNFSAKELGIYIPSPEDVEAVRRMEAEADRASRYL